MLRFGARMIRPLLILLLLGACSRSERAPESSAARDAAPPPIECVSGWRAVAAGAEYRMLNCSPEQRRFDLHLVRVDPKLFHLDAVMQPGTTAESLSRDWPFAQNANFFDDQYRALGVVMSGGRELNPAHRVSWQSVFLVTRDGKARIVPVAEWDGVKADAVTALQAGPRLVIAGKRNEVKQAKPTWRSGVCIDARQRAIFFATPQESMFDVWQMVDFAARPEADGGLGCRDAMLFDGGPSTQFNLRGAGAVEGDKRVPAFVVGRP
jgi:uncharacterized protein YigE (DUF2233 family)